jgi:hypothetical protein
MTVCLWCIAILVDKHATIVDRRLAVWADYAGKLAFQQENQKKMRREFEIHLAQHLYHTRHSPLYDIEITAEEGKAYCSDEIPYNGPVGPPPGALVGYNEDEARKYWQWLAENDWVNSGKNV